MKPHDAVFASLYTLNKRLDPHPDKSVLPAFLLMTLLTGFNLLSVYVVVYALTRNNSMLNLGDFTYLCFFAVPLVLWGVLFFKKRRYEKILTELQKAPEERKRAFWIMGVTYVILTILVSTGSFLLLADW